LDKENKKFNRSKKDAATLLQYMDIKKFKSKDVLKKIERNIIVTKPLPINELPIQIELRAFMLKNRYSARYYRLY